MRNGARKTVAWLVVSILMTTCRAQSVPGPTCGGQFDFPPWREDFGQLTAEMGAHYANPESSQRERHMDLPKLRQETLGGASTQSEPPPLFVMSTSVRAVFAQTHTIRHLDDRMESTV